MKRFISLSSALVLGTATATRSSHAEGRVASRGHHDSRGASHIMGGGDHDHRRHERRGDRSDYGDVQGMWGDDDDLNDFDFGGDDVQDILDDL